MKPQIYKIKEIGKGFLAIMAKPVAGDWIDDEFKGISDFGILQIISLLEAHESYELGLIEEEKLANQNGMDFINYKIKDRGVPESPQNFIKITKTIYNQINDGKNTVIHCRAGIGRTGIVAAGILMHFGYDIKKAFEYISEIRGVRVPDTQEQIDWMKSIKF